MSKAVIGTVMSNELIAENIFDMRIKCEAVQTAQYGQFMDILCEGGDALLRRPISICDINGDIIRIVYEVKGKGTLLLSKYIVGQSIDMLAPLGNGFKVIKTAYNPLIIGGGIGIYPLLGLAKSLHNPKIFLGFRNCELITLYDEFSKVGELTISTDDGSFGYHGRVNSPVSEFLEKNKSDIIYACGPIHMLKAVKEIGISHNIPTQLSMEARMACGIGACLVCSCKTTKGYAKVCSDGPVFDSRDIIFE